MLCFVVLLVNKWIVLVGHDTKRSRITVMLKFLCISNRDTGKIRLQSHYIVPRGIISADAPDWRYYRKSLPNASNKKYIPLEMIAFQIRDYLICQFLDARSASRLGKILYFSTWLAFCNFFVQDDQFLLLFGVISSYYCRKNLSHVSMQQMRPC